LSSDTLPAIICVQIIQELFVELLSLRTIHGPNIYHNRPVLIMKIDLKDWAEVASSEIADFNERLLQLLPGLQKHTCSPGYEGGFIERLRRGTYMAHVTEHVAIELSSLAGMDISFGKSRYAGSPGVYHVVTRFENEAGMKSCLEAAFRLVKALLEGKDFIVTEEVEKIKEVVSENRLGPSTAAIFAAAKKFNIPCRRVGENSLLYLGYGKNLKKVQTAVTEKTSLIATELVQDKNFTKEYLKEFSVPVPRGGVVRTEAELLEMVADLRPPLAIKPVDGHHGNGVCLNLVTKEEMLKAFARAREECPRVLVEEMVRGNDYRILVIDGKLVAAAERQPPSVVGNGVDTIATLIGVLNQDPRRDEGHAGFLTKIELDADLADTLQKSGVSLATVLEPGRRVFLRETANLSTGGTAKDVTDLVHPGVKCLCQRIARIVGLDICGIDAIANSLSENPEAGGFQVIEVNAGPGLRMHLAPTEGEPRPVGEAIVNMLYPDPKQARIPIAAVTGTNGKTTVARMMSKMFASLGHTVGMTSSDGVWIGGSQIMHGDTSGPVSARTILNDPGVDFAVLEVARGGIMRGGLAYDWSDIGIITNIRKDHLGQDGINDIEDLVWVKSLVAERVREGGTLILNADDEQSLKLAHTPRIMKIPRNILLYSTSGKNPAVSAHLAAHKDACWVEDGQFVGFFQGRSVHFGAVKDYPVTMKGAAHFQVSNTLAVIAAGLAQGISPAQITLSLQEFNPTLENPGRLNLYKVHDATVILDYGHNPDAISAIGEMLSRYQNHRKTAVFGLPGDRETDLIAESGEVVGRYFDRVVLRDDLDLRGRAPGEVPGLLEKVLAATHAEVETLIRLDEKEALDTALADASAKDIIVVFYDTLSFVKKVLLEYDPQPLATLPDVNIALAPSRNSRALDPLTEPVDDFDEIEMTPFGPRLRESV
jgi:cyanophycin synthetase